MLNFSNPENFIHTFFRSASYRTYNIEIAKLLGGVEYAVILTDLIDQYFYFQSKDMLVSDPKSGEKVFYYTEKIAWERCAIQSKTLLTAVRKLEALKIIETFQFGLPKKKYFKINLDNLMTWINSNISSRSSVRSDCKLPKELISCKDIHISKDPYKEPEEEDKPSSLALGLSSFLSEKIKKNNPKAKDPNLKSWGKIFDLMLKHDDFSEPEIRELIEFSQSDPFWHANILSPMKLRKHANTLVLQMKKNALKPSNDVLERSSENKTWATNKSKEVIRGSLFGKVRIWDARAEVYIPHSEEWISLDYRELAFREQFISLLRKGGYL